MSSELRPSPLVAEGIDAGYGDHTVLNNVSVESHEGVTCIFGPNGSGKSTLLKTLNGIVTPWAGKVTYGDVDITRAPPEEIVRHGVATLPQGGGVFGSLTVRENLVAGGFTAESDEATRARIDAVLESFPALEEKMGERASSLSGGQQMMVSLGRAMMTGADTYLLDEPSAGLSPALVDDAFDLIERLVDRGARVMLVEQNVTAGLRLADHVYVLAEGELQFDGVPSELAERDDLIELYLGIG